jgi:kinetochore protein Spc7/SPC105
MTYKQEVELVFDMAAFQPNRKNGSIDLWYIADTRDTNPVPRTAIHDFFLENIRDQIRSIPQSQTPVSKMLSMVQTGWDKARVVSRQTSDVNIAFPTVVARRSDSAIAITSSLLLVPLETRVEAVLNLHSHGGTEGLDIEIAPEAKVIYGEHFNVGKVGEFLATRIGKAVALAGAEAEEWGDVMTELHQRLIARGRKQ